MYTYIYIYGYIIQAITAISLHWNDGIEGGVTIPIYGIYTQATQVGEMLYRLYLPQDDYDLLSHITGYIWLITYIQV